MSVFNTLNTSIYSRLSGGTALTTTLGGTAIFYQQAPDNEGLPYVVWSYASGMWDNIEPKDIWSGVAWIRAYAASPAQAGSIDAAVHALLHQQALSVTGWTNFWLVREGDHSFVENLPNGKKVFTAGGHYRIRLSE